MSDEDDFYWVVVNGEGQYSLWKPTGKPMPSGWWTTEAHGARAVCMAYIESMWKDERPLALRHPGAG